MYRQCFWFLSWQTGLQGSLCDDCLYLGCAGLCRGQGLSGCGERALLSSPAARELSPCGPSCGGAHAQWLWHMRSSWVRDQTHVSGKPAGVPLIIVLHQFQFSRSVVSDSLRPMDHSTPGFPVHHQLPEPAQTHVHRVGDAIQPSHPLHPLLLPPSIFPSIRVFSNESVLLIRWPKYWSFSFNISPSNENSGMTSFRMV